MLMRMSSQSKTPSEKSKAQVFASRLFSTVLLWVLVAGVFVSGNAWAFLGMMTLLGVFSVWEFFQMTKRGGMPAQACWGLLAGVAYLLVLCFLLAERGFEALGLLHRVDVTALVVVTLVAFLIPLRRQVEGKKTLTEVAVTVLGFVYVAVLFSFMMRLLFVPQLEGNVPGAWLVLWLVAVTKFTDMGAYITGSLIGKHKMIPHISPAKTWEGFAGALLFSQLAACGLYAMMPDALSVLGGWGSVVILALVLALLAVVGDLAESVIKRSIGVKDSGNTLPGIGGALDLIDSLCFTAPVLYFYLMWS